MQDIQEHVLKLEALKDLLSETDRNLAIEAFPDVTIIYGRSICPETTAILTRYRTCIVVASFQEPSKMSPVHFRC